MGTRCTGNIIGTRKDGLGELGNGQSGVTILNGSRNNQIGGGTTGQGNLISGNGDHGVYILGAGTSGNQILANRIGTNRDGTAAIPNESNGVLIQGANSMWSGRRRPATGFQAISAPAW